MQCGHGLASYPKPPFASHRGVVRMGPRCTNVGTIIYVHIRVFNSKIHKIKIFSDKEMVTTFTYFLASFITQFKWKSYFK